MTTEKEHQEMVEQARRPMKEYYAQHKACPKCGNTKTGQTYVGFLQHPYTNKAWCSCGWSGIVDDLKPEYLQTPHELKVSGR
jgi:hypothetical protein